MQGGLGESAGDTLTRQALPDGLTFAPMGPSTTIAFDYAAFVADLKTRITSARLTATRAVNSELVGLYWDIGAAIREK